MHEDWLHAFNENRQLGADLDVTAVGALFGHLFPGSKWSDLPQGRPLPPTIEVALMKCFARSKIQRPRQLRSIVKKTKYRRRLETYAAAVGTSVTEVSNFA